MLFEGKNYIFVREEKIVTNDKNFTLAKFHDPETFENFSMFVPDEEGIIFPKEKSKVNVFLRPYMWNGRTSFRLVDVKPV